ncbi:unnamed protein product [Anisakis simplex]|uniref:BPI2 domain-containing protein n=1 Tax=Anisakis simplex TaxID=6269 RepID=A0A0M3JCZ7_ANISI|nr:unnamed protein product [Anisakis simplex]
MILKTLLIDIIKVFAQSLLHVGVPLPVVDNVTLANDAYIVTKTGFVRISSDFIYEHSIP